VRRRLLAVAIVALSLLALLALGAFPQDPLRRLVERRLGTALGGRATIGRFHVVPANLTVDLHDVSFDAPGLRGRVGRVHVRARASALSGQFTSLHALELHGLEVDARATQTSAAAPSAALPHVDIGRLVVHAAALRYNDPALGDVSLSAFEASGGIGREAVSLNANLVVAPRDMEPVSGAFATTLQVGPDLDTRIVAASLTTAASSLSVSGALGILTAPRPDLRFDGRIDAAEASRMARGGAAQGLLQATGRLKAGPRLEWEADLRAERLEARGLAVTDLKGRLSGKGEDVTLRLAFGVLGGRVDADGRSTAGVLAARVGAKDIRAASLLPRASLSRPAAGTVSGTLALSGPASKLDVTFALDTAELAIDEVPLSLRAEARGTLAPAGRELGLTWTLEGDARPASKSGDGARVAGAHLEASGTASGAGVHRVSATANVRLDVAGPDGTLRAVPVEIAYRGRGESVETLTLRVPETPLLGLVPEAAGFARLDVDASGRLSRLSGSARLEVLEAEWRKVALGPIRVDATGRDGDWTLTAGAPAHELRLEARSPLPGRGARRIAGSLILAGSAVEPLRPLLPAAFPPDGRVTGQVAFDGPVTEPTALSLRGDLRLEGGGYSATLEGTGAGSPGSSLDLRVAGRADLAVLDRSESFDLTGDVVADLRIQGTRNAPRATGEVRLTSATLAGSGLPDVRVPEAVVAVDGSSAELRPTDLAVADGTVTASGRYPLAGTTPAELHLEWKGLAADTLLQALAPGAAGGATLRSRLSGRADLSGGRDDLAGWRGHASIAAEDVKAADLELTLSPLALRLDGGILEADAVTLRSGPSSLTVQGRFDLPKRDLALEGRGAVDLRALSPLLGDTSLSGTAELDVSVAGWFEAPQARGSVVIRDGAVRARDLPEALTEIGARLVFEADTLRLSEAKAKMGGGDVTASGRATFRGSSLHDVRIDIQGRDMALRYPVGLRSRLDADLVLTRAGAGYLLRGDVKALRGVYDLDLALEQNVKAPTARPEPSPLLRSVALDIRVALDSPVLLRNKLASLDVDGSLQFRGDLETPAPFGRLDTRDGGKIYVTGRQFAVSMGRLAYGGDWDPTVTLRAECRVPDEDDASERREYDVTLGAEGPLSSVQPTFRSEGLSDGQVLSLVATGRKTGGSGTLGAHVAGQQAANLALGQLSHGLGLDEIAVQPELLARETDPGTRFTFGKQLTPMLSLIYSLSLKGAEQRFVQVEARLPYQVFLKGQRIDDGTFAVGAGQRIRLGGPKRPAISDDRVRLRDVRFEGELPSEARAAVRAKAGKRVVAWDLQEDADRLRARLVEDGYVEAQVGGRIEEGVAVFRVQTGPLFAWRVEGMPEPPDLGAAFREALFEEDAVERARTLLVATLRKRSHLKGRVAAVRHENSGSVRTLVFAVEPGPSLRAAVEFPGRQSLSAKSLLRAVGGPGALLTTPEAALARIEQAYAEARRFGVKAGPLDVDESQAPLRIRVPIDEGAAPRIAALRFSGASLPADELRTISRLVEGSPYATANVAAAAERIRNHYYSRGHAQAGVVVLNTQRGNDVEVEFQVREGQRAVIGAVEIVGRRRTRESVVRRHVQLKPGDPLDPRRLAGTERRLLDLGMFSQVLVTASPDSPSTVRIQLVEKDLVEAAYDLRWSEQTQTTVQLDAEWRHLLGVGLNLGGRYRLGGEDREKRLSLAMPTIRRGKFTVAAFETQEDFEATDIITGEPITNTLTERVIEFEQTLPIQRRTNVLAGYRFKSVSSTTFPAPIHIASVDLSGVRETRDNPLDARLGRFASLNFQLSPKALGSDFTFIKGFGQFYLHRSLTPSWTWSQGYRLGLGHGFGGQELISSERFEAGGTYSLRGFAQDSVGPKDFLGEPKGGDAVLIFNQEVRYRHRSGWGMALFWDAGNVFEDASDLSLDLRHDLGGGLRWVSPVGLLRLDLAVPLARREGEDKYQVFFSLGQAF